MSEQLAGTRKRGMPHLVPESHSRSAQTTVHSDKGRRRMQIGGDTHSTNRNTQLREFRPAHALK